MIKTLYKVLGFEDKVPWKSLTAWGLALWLGVDGAVVGLCENPELTFDGIMTTGNAFCDKALNFSDTFGQVLTGLGIRKAANKNA